MFWRHWIFWEPIDGIQDFLRMCQNLHQPKTVELNGWIQTAGLYAATSRTILPHPHADGVRS